MSGYNAETDAVRHATQKRRIIRMLLAYSAIAGLIAYFLPEEETPLDYVVGLPFLILGISWCFTDAAERDHRIGGVMKFTLVLLFVVGFPLYVFLARGIRGFKTLVFALLLLAGMIACFFVAYLATLYAGDTIGM
jgi:apolipoprotein N-acyltransferase